MLMRSDPFRELDRFANHALGTAARPAVMPMDAWREGENLVVEFDLPGINVDSLDIDVERNVVTVRAERPALDPNREMLATE
ncbi:Hsp20/alpha crystallin family protein, partial [Mycobacterium sp.]|uniref:Hsp20/alpha crystallin family protein n=1 Tax=Mycobacterium sp. TaxID=1785 RepID=UPI003F9A7BF9